MRMDAVESQKGLIRVTCKFDESNNDLLISVIDNGVGIPPSMMDHMFELFHSTKGESRHGIGLAVARKNCGGARWLDRGEERKPGRGPPSR